MALFFRILLLILLCAPVGAQVSYYGSEHLSILRVFRKPFIGNMVRLEIRVGARPRTLGISNFVVSTKGHLGQLLCGRDRILEVAPDIFIPNWGLLWWQIPDDRSLVGATVHFQWWGVYCIPPVSECGCRHLLPSNAAKIRITSG